MDKSCKRAIRGLKACPCSGAPVSAPEAICAGFCFGAENLNCRSCQLCRLNKGNGLIRKICPYKTQKLRGII